MNGTQLKQTIRRRPNRKTKYGCGDGLHLVHHPNGSAYFLGRMTVHISGQTKRSEVHIGKYDNDFSLSDAKEEWSKIKLWAKTNNRMPNDYYKEEEQKKVIIPHTFGDAVEGFIQSKREGRDAIKTWQNYHRIFNSTIYPLLSPSTPLDSLKESNGGRQRLDHVYEEIIGSNERHELARRSRQLIRQAIEFATKKGWLSNNENAAVPLSIERSKRKVEHHPHLSWEEIPQLIEDINLNKCSMSPHTVLATKFLMLTALRTGALARLTWEMIDEKKNIINISGEVTGIKRTGVNDHIPLLVPITDVMWKIIDKCGKLNRGEEYLFLSNGLGKKVHADPSAPNRYLTNLGYRRRQTAHGWRSVFLTNGIEVLKEREVVIRRQMGHLPEGKVSKAYDHSELLEERYNFLTNWSNLLVKKGLEV